MYRAIIATTLLALLFFSFLFPRLARRYPQHAYILGGIGKHAAGIVFSIALGLVGGAICGAAILSFGDLIGRSGTTGEEYVGHWSVGDIEIGFMYGAPFGAVVAPFAYATLVQAIGFKRAVLPATLGTLAGGFLGSVLGGPIIAQLTGIVGFFFALLLARIHFGVVRRDSWL